MMRVLIADDYAIIRHGLKQIIEDNIKMCVVAEAATGTEALFQLRKFDFDVILLDIAMPGMSCIDTLKHIRMEYPKLPVLILSIYPEDQYAVRLLKAGAAGYLNKEVAPASIIEALRCVISGQKYISQAVADIIADKLSRPHGVLPHENLSDRESQIFLMLASAKTVTDIANTLTLSVKTISTYRRRILEKMSLSNNAELMYYAAAQRLTI